VVTQWIFAAVFSNTLHMILAASVSIIIMILSIIQTVAFHNKFLGYHLTKEA